MTSLYRALSYIPPPPSEIDAAHEHSFHYQLYYTHTVTFFFPLANLIIHPPTKMKSLTKVVYKPSTQSTDEFTVIVNADEVCLYDFFVDDRYADLGWVDRF